MNEAIEVTGWLNPDRGGDGVAWLRLEIDGDGGMVLRLRKLDHGSGVRITASVEVTFPRVLSRVLAGVAGYGPLVKLARYQEPLWKAELDVTAAKDGAGGVSVGIVVRDEDGSELWGYFRQYDIYRVAEFAERYAESDR